MPPKLSEHLTKDELNLSEYPFALLSRSNEGAPKTIRCASTRMGLDGVEVERCWTVTGSDLYGLPTAGDEAVYLCLMQMARDQGFASRTVEFSCSDLLERLGLGDGGPGYQRLRASLLRLQTVALVADEAFYDVGRKQYRTLAFGILDGFALSSKKGERCFVDFNRKLWEFIAAGSVKTLDLGLYLSLDGYVARRLYRYLDKHAYDGKPSFSIGVDALAFSHLGMPKHYPPSKVRRFLDAAHVELIGAGFLSDAAYRDGKDGGRVVSYRFVRAKDRGQARALIDELVAVGVSPVSARQIVSEFAADRIRLQVAALKGLAKKPRNVGGWLRAAVEAQYSHKGRSKARSGASGVSGVFDVVKEDKPASEVILEARKVLGDQVVNEIEQRIAAEVLSGPMFRGRPVGKGARLLIAQKLATEIEDTYPTIQEVPEGL